ncbi:hypothetical protein L1987_30867 [Smallanthus sonchifolius]|uniref:Uncharacterized protein n=1 Tax=Smallanthus sonchifolius TaxID=185202 RepID=A0ACB9I5A8_9ASTR|nr:hypothetical protein L1987_30867 [Smallanthus sonchifolius]
MKKDWQAVYDMLNATSGFGYDKEHNCVTTNAPGVWETYLENHKWAAKWKNKKLPHYEELCVVFGKVRAQGNRAKSVIEMEEDMNAQEQELEQEQEGDDDFVVDMEDNHDEYISIPSVQVEETSSARTKKRKDMNKSSSMLKNFNDAVSLFADRLKESSKESSEGIKFEMDLERKKAMITNELSKMTSMTQFERFRAIKKIKNDQDSVITFWDLNEEEREDWVKFMLKE